jgi:hypothetical protein
MAAFTNRPTLASLRHFGSEGMNLECRRDALHVHPGC